MPFFLFFALSAADLTSDLLRRESGVRALGLGGAFTAVAEDTSALFYNPAGLANRTVQFNYGEDDLNRRDGLKLGVERGFKLGNLAYGQRHYVDEELNWSQIDSYGFGVKTKQGIDYGLTYKKITQEGPDNLAGVSWGLDLGLLAHLTPTWRLGLNAQNFSGGNLDVKPSYRFGTAWKVIDRVLFVYDNEVFHPHDTPNSAIAHYGVEWDAADGFTLRLGKNDKNTTYGVSLGFLGLIWEYAVEEKEREIIYRFGLKMGSDRYKDQRRYVVNGAQEILLIDLSKPLVSGQDGYTFIEGLLPGGDNLLNTIRYAAEDNRITGILIKMKDLPNSLSYVGLVQELRTELVAFKEKGKKVIIYIEDEISENSYYLATVADKIIMNKMGALVSLGKSLTVTRLSGFLEKIGLNYQTFKAGEYKDATSPFNEAWTEAQEKQLTALVKDLNNQIIEDIKKERNLNDDQVAIFSAGGIITATKALSLGLIDQIAYYEDIKDILKEVTDLEHDPKFITPLELPTNVLDTVILPVVGTVAIIDIDGQIVSGRSKQNILTGEKNVGAESIIEILNEIKDKDDVQAVVLRINSPGGSALASDMIYRKVKELREEHKKYVVVSMGNIAASGGYYIACAGNKIIANRGTLTGSIGVIGGVLKGSALYSKLGIKEDTIKTGEHLDMYSFGRQLSAAEIKMIEDYQRQIYDEFKMIVALERNLHMAEMEQIAGGRIWSGQQAKQVGLIDDFGSVFDAIELAKTGAGIKGKARVIRMVHTEDYGLLTIRSKISAFLGLDSLGFNNLNKSKLAEFNSYLY